MLFRFGLIPLLISIYIGISVLWPLKWKLRYKFLAWLIIAFSSGQMSLMMLMTSDLALGLNLPLWVTIGGTWLFGSWFFLLFLSIAKDACFLLWKFIQLTVRKIPKFPHQYVNLTLMAIAMGLAAYGVYEAFRPPKIQYVEIESDKIAPELDGVTIAVLADLHISYTYRRPYVARVVKQINSLNADFVVLPGDTVDGTYERRANDAEPLKDLHARYGVWGVPGNHEYYMGFDEWMKCFAELGINMLNNSHAVFEINGAKLVIAGITDEAARIRKLEMPDLAKALDGAPSDAYTVLLSHRPGGAAHNAAQGVDLQFSGHTHGGLVIGFDRIVASHNEGFCAGRYQVDDMVLYVSRGASLWHGFLIRVGVPAEITLLTLRSATK